ncbi:SHOCT domain-containing protein [Geomonas sp.]|uniref:SHOCT domain-containing protein n=1 Tax=Geomonas sp. TaxID=2651584 RepID=UPI002B4985B4|nr:SHOCT domain-containing protein [Geomonas sp.]
MFVALILSVFTLISGCATQKTFPIWQSGDEFVSLADRDDLGKEQGGANRHPVSLSRADLRDALAALAVELPGDPKPVPLFGNPELEVLSEQLRLGLEHAGKDQDLLFAVLGAKPIFKAFGTLAVVTTGRVFYQDNGLNLILGRVRSETHGDDRRLDPFVPGSRLREATLPGPVLMGSGKAPHLPGRSDWLVFPVRTEAERPAPKPEPVTQKPAAPEPQQPAVREPAREVPQRAPQGVTPGTAASNIEQRLRTLDDLKAKGLITDEEYRAKRKSILNEL